MVDYNLLEKMVDDALSKETKESLTEWIRERLLLDIIDSVIKYCEDLEDENNNN